MNSGTPQEQAGPAETRIDAGRMVVDVVVDDIGRNGQIPRALAGRYQLADRLV